MRAWRSERAKDVLRAHHPGVQALIPSNPYLQDRRIDVALDFGPDQSFNHNFEGIDIEGMIPGVLPLRKAVVFILVFGRYTWPPGEKTEDFHHLIQARVARDGSNSFQVHVYNIGRHGGLSRSDEGLIGVEGLSITITPLTAATSHSPRNTLLPSPASRT